MILCEFCKFNKRTMPNHKYIHCISNAECLTITEPTTFCKSYKVHKFKLAQFIDKLKKELEVEKQNERDKV